VRRCVVKKPRTLLRRLSSRRTQVRADAALLLPLAAFTNALVEPAHSSRVGRRAAAWPTLTPSFTSQCGSQYVSPVWFPPSNQIELRFTATRDSQALRCP
jgi:hypothetical protein